MVGNVQAGKVSHCLTFSLSILPFNSIFWPTFGDFFGVTLPVSQFSEFSGPRVCCFASDRNPRLEVGQIERFVMFKTKLVADK